MERRGSKIQFNFSKNVFGCGEDERRRQSEETGESLYFKTMMNNFEMKLNGSDDVAGGRILTEN